MCSMQPSMLSFLSSKMAKPIGPHQVRQGRRRCTRTLPSTCGDTELTKTKVVCSFHTSLCCRQGITPGRSPLKPYAASCSWSAGVAWITKDELWHYAQQRSGRCPAKASRASTAHYGAPILVQVQFFEHKAILSRPGTTDITAHGQTGDHRIGGQERQLCLPGPGRYPG